MGENKATTPPNTTLNNSLYDANIDSNVRIVGAIPPAKKFYLVDRLIGLIFALSAVYLGLPFVWIDLSSVPLESSMTYREFLETQSLEGLSASMNLSLSLIDLLTMSNETNSPAKIIFREEYPEGLEAAGHPAPIELIHIQGDELVLGIAGFGFLLILVIGLASLIAGFPFAPLGIVSQLLGRRLLFGLSLLVLLAMLISTWLWFFLYLSPTLEQIFLSQNLSILPYNSISLVGQGFWINQGLLVVLMVLCSSRVFSRKVSENF